MTDDASGEGERLVGQGIGRREDAALLTGAAEFTDDRSAPGMAHLAFARSTEAHARVEGVDASAAEAMDGVRAVYTWADVAASDVPGVLPIASGALEGDPPGHPMLARETVRYEGQPVAAVVADDRYRARDAAAAVDVEYDPRDVVTGARAALDADAPLVYESVPGNGEGAPDNLAARAELGDADATEAAFAAADTVVEVDLVNNRLIPNALEPRAALARYDADGGHEGKLTVELTSQSAHGHRGKLATTLGLPERRIRILIPSVGGGFGHKGHHHPGEAAASFAAMDLEIPVKWTATRGENYIAGAHGRDHRTSAAMAVDDDGTVRGLRVETDANVGAYGLGGSAAMPGWYGSLLACQYEFEAIHCETRSVFTHTTPVHSYRGAGRPEAVYVTERLVHVAARELGMDPAELRRRNQIDPEEFPYETPVGATYDSGDYETGLDEALDAADYEALRERPDRDGEGRYLGVGIGSYVESTGGGHESGVVRVHPDGSVAVAAGTHSHGQGHGTTYAQIVADVLPVGYDDVDVSEGDSDATPTGTGTFGSRSTITGGNAVAESAREVREKARVIAADRLEAAPDDVVVDGTDFRVRGTDRTVAFAEVADAAYGWGVPEGVDPGLEATTFFQQEDTAYSFGTHVVAVAVDPETGDVAVERYVALDDCGERVNPTIVEGQIEGGVAQGLGQARSEQTVYDEDGHLVTNTMLDYGIPRAADVPDVEIEATVTPSPTNDLGVKGIGEAGTMAAPPAVVNAVADALAPLGIRHVDMPLTAERVWRAIREASG